MFHSMLNRFGLTRLSWKRPTHRASQATTVKAIVAATSSPGPKLSRELHARARVARVPDFHTAVRVFAGSIGQIGRKPSVEELDRARAAVPADIWAYLMALALVEKRIPLLSESSVGVAAAEEGFIHRLTENAYSDLETWSAVAARENSQRKEARYTGRAIPAPITIPAEVLAMLEDRDRLRAGRGRRRKPGDGRSPT